MRTAIGYPVTQPDGTILQAPADHRVDMGPGGGPDGGHIVAAGTPEDVARAPASATGPWLAEHLGLPAQAQQDQPSGAGH